MEFKLLVSNFSNTDTFIADVRMVNGVPQIRVDYDELEGLAFVGKVEPMVEIDANDFDPNQQDITQLADFADELMIYVRGKLCAAIAEFAGSETCTLETPIYHRNGDIIAFDECGVTLDGSTEEADYMDFDEIDTSDLKQIFEQIKNSKA